MSEDSKEESKVTPVLKKKLWDIVNEEFFDRLEARLLPNGNCALSDPETGRDVIIMHRFKEKHEAIELLFEELKTPLGSVFFDSESSRQHATEKGILYSPQWADLFCSHIYHGKDLTDICALPNMPTYETVWKWRKRYPEFEEKFQAAFEARGERLRDEVYKNSRQMVHEDSPENYQQRKAHIENLKWLASKDNPKRFSSHVEVHNTAPTVRVVVETGIRHTENHQRVRHIDSANMPQDLPPIPELLPQPSEGEPSNE